METFSTPVGIGLILLGVGIIIYWIKDNLRIIDTKPRSQSKPSSTATSSAKPAEPSWSEYKNRTDYGEFILDSRNSDGQWAAFLMAVMEGKGTRVKLVRYAEDNSIAFTIGGKHLHTLSHSDIEKVSSITSKPDVMFISDAYNNNSGRIVVTIRIYK